MLVDAVYNGMPADSSPKVCSVTISVTCCIKMQ
jgi:hypothetical protein